MSGTDQLHRRLRFQGGKFTLLSERDSQKDFHLCQICSLRDSCLMTRRVDAIMTEFNISAPITECPVYRPKLVFRPPLVGLEGKFNTIRIGRAWQQRLQPGTVVSMVDSADEKEIGLARVLHSLAGPYQDLAGAHARFNHMMLDKVPLEAPALMHKVLTRCYGTTFFTAERQVSVIYLERIHEDGQAAAS